MARLVLVPSPFVGAVAWRATADLLSDAVAADYGGATGGPDPYGRVARAVAAQAGPGPWIAVLHSGAGGFAPALAQAAPGLAGFIFIDAILPHPGRSNLETAPAELAERLARLTTDGALAPWNLWFEADPLPRLIPDPAARAAFAEGLPRTPFAFLQVTSPASDAWEHLPSAYLQLSRNYDAAALSAQERGWTVAAVRRHHLAMASHPAEVAPLLADLAAQLVA